MWFEPKRRKRPSTKHRRSPAGNRSEQADAEPVEERPRSLSQVGYSDSAARGHERIRERGIVALDQQPGPEVGQEKKSSLTVEQAACIVVEVFRQPRGTTLTGGLHEGAAMALTDGLAVVERFRDVLEELDPVLVARLRACP